MFPHLLIIFIASLVIYFAGNRFAKASTEIGDYFNISHAVKGATLDAIAGSLPELLIAIFSVVFFKEFDMGVGTVAGSVLFNILIIPSIAVLVSPVVFRVSREVMARDAIFFIFSIFAFVVAILYSNVWGLAMAVVFLGGYAWYLNLIIEQTEDYQKKFKKPLGEKISVTREIIVASFSLVIIGASAYFLTKHAILFSRDLGIPALLIGFSIVAFTTSIPDTIIATFNAKQGRTDDVMSNVFGSNIFNILIGLGAPLFLATALTGRDVHIDYGEKGIIIGLLIASILVTYFIIDDYKITKRNAFIMILTYLVFIAYLAFISFF